MSFQIQFEICSKNEDILLSCLLDTRTKDFIVSNRLFFSEDQYELAKMMLKTWIELTENTVISGVVKPMNGKFDKFSGETDENIVKQISNEYDCWVLSKEVFSKRYSRFNSLSSNLFEYWKRIRFLYCRINTIAENVFSEEHISYSS